MGDVVKMNTAGEVAPVDEEDALLEVTHGLLMDVRTTLDSKKTMSVPIA